MNVIRENGVYICPYCGSRKITEISQNVLIKHTNVNTGKLINPFTGKGYMSNRDKADEYDRASMDGIGCWYYECRRCGWMSSMFVE